jgi:glyoxylase-like metal-dependent hydrolase (beta-lactamase superfamily II)
MRRRDGRDITLAPQRQEMLVVSDEVLCDDPGIGRLARPDDVEPKVGARGERLQHWHFYGEEGEDWFGFRSVRALDDRDGEILIVPLPGHTLGQRGIAVRGNGKWLLHAGDAYFFHGQLAARPHAPLLLGLFQRKGDIDRAARLANQERLRQLKCDHGDQIVIVNSHDAAGYDACRCCEKRLAVSSDGSPD